ncbi:O-antigen ligase family protein [Myceligenerans xiligouense]|uniref:O-antigen ligase family protein n=1 Tax=Myceligenerans xiligouense TaxID=253184 RepID=UPI001476BA73|nr:O-antigen ligase family protein [Myceligenerans xiligouense]
MNTTLGVCLLVVGGRGVFEAVASKQIGYVAQAVAIVVIIVLGLTRGFTKRHGKTGLFVAAYLFLMVELLSVAYVTSTSTTADPWNYVVVMTMFALVLCLSGALEFDGLARTNVMGWLAVVGLVAVAVAVIQQRSLLLDVFGGSDLSSLGGTVRPAALTGSYLHYPLMISLICFAFVQAWVSTRRRWYGIVALVLAAAVAASYSRSGMVILAGGVLCHFVLSSGLGRRIRLGFAILVAAVVAFLAFEGTPYWSRYIGGLDSGAAGNEARITKWYAGMEYWFDSPLLIGGYTGQFTNVTGNLGGEATGVLESGLVQQLVSFGLVGTILFYLLMVGVVLAVKPAHRWLKAGLVAAMLQTLVYQSIEVVPFMVLFSLMPLVSSHIDFRSSGAQSFRSDEAVDKSTRHREQRSLRSHTLHV